MSFFSFLRNRLRTPRTGRGLERPAPRRRTCRLTTERLEDRLCPNGSWVTEAPLPAAVGDSTSAALNGALYVAGGVAGPISAALQAYNPATNAWTPLATMPGGRAEAVGGAINGHLYVAGGLTIKVGGNPPHIFFGPNNSLFIYDPASNTWTTGASIPHLSAYGAAGAINNKLYVYTPSGGGNGNADLLDVYDPGTNGWTSLAPPPDTHFEPAGFGVMNGKLYIAGGNVAGSLATTILDVYDPATNSWTTAAPMPTAASFGAGAVLGGKLYVVGGEDASGNALSVVQVYDPATNTWSTDTPALTARFGATAGVVNGVLYAFGGDNSSGFLATNEAFTAQAPPVVPRPFPSLLTLGSAPIYVAKLYQDVLGRPADPSGLASWSSFLSAGNSRAQMVLDLEASQEYRNDEVDHVYTTLLQRPPDPPGLGQWSAALAAGLTIEQMEADIVGSPEYYQNRGGSTTEGFLTALYQDILQRTPDAGGLSAFTQAMRNGASRTQVASVLLQSTEFLQDDVEGAYELFLARSADPASLNGWVAAMQAGLTDQQLVAGLVSSNEYFNFSQARGPLNANAPLESVTQMVSAVQGGTLTLPDGSKVTIPAGALPQDEQVTLSLYAAAAPVLMPDGMVTSTGPVLDLSFPTAQSAVSIPANSPGLQFQLQLGSNPSVNITQAGALADIITTSGTDQFIGINHDANATSPSLGVPLTFLQSATEISVSLDALVDPAAVAAGPKIFSPSSGQWEPLPGGFNLQSLQGRRVLFVLPGMASTVTASFKPAYVQNILKDGGYDVALGYDYNFSQGIAMSGGQVAAFLNQLPAGVQVDGMGSSEGGMVLLSAYAQGSLQTQMDINKLFLLAVPITGTPVATTSSTLGANLLASAYLYLALPNMNTAGPFVGDVTRLGGITLLSTINGNPATFPDILTGQFAADLTPGSPFLTQLYAALASKLGTSKKLYVAAGQVSLAQLLLSVLFNGAANDGLIPLSSQLGQGSGLENNINVLGVFPDVHGTLQCDPAVQQAIGQAVAYAKLSVITPQPIPFVVTQCQPKLAPKPLIISNSGSRYSTLEYSVSVTSDNNFLSVSGVGPVNALGGRESQTIEVGGSAIGMSPGTYMGFITITDKTNNTSQVVQVTLTVNPCPPPPSMFTDVNAGFVTSVYVDLLQRQPDAGGLASWTAALDRGLPRVDMVEAVQASPEYQRIIVDVLYNLFLNRSASPEDIAAWSNFLNSGGTIEQIEAALVSSPEFYLSEGGGSDDGYLEALYRYTLGRDVDPSGQAAFAPLLAAGGTAEVVNALFSSSEFLQDDVNRLYMEFLHRTADSASLNGFVRALQQGVSSATLAAYIMSSGEFFPLPPPPPPPPPTDPFAGTYQGTYMGTAFLDNGQTFPVTPKPVDFTEANGVITVTVPATGTGTLSASGAASFTSAIGTASSGNATAQFGGTFVITANGVVASGNWVSSFGPSGPIPGGTANGTWVAQRL